MKTKHLTSFLRDDLTTLSVTFDLDYQNRGMQGVNVYTYKVLKSDVKSAENPHGVGIGDFVVVPHGPRTSEAKRAAQQGMPAGYASHLPTENFGVAVVVDVHETALIDTDADFSYKWIVGGVSLDRYKAIIAHDAAMLEVMQEVEKAERRRTVEERYKAVLEANPKLAAKFSALKAGPLALPSVNTTIPKD